MNFIDFENFHRGSSIIVYGLGASMGLLPKDFYHYPSIGVNDIGRSMTPAYLLNVNNRSQYKGDRYDHIRDTKASSLFTHVPKEQPGVLVPIIEFKIQKNPGGFEVDREYLVPHYRCSPYMACALAAYMGATKIGLIGCDFTDNHFWAPTGRHRLTGELSGIDKQFGAMAEVFKMKGISLVNLSPMSLLKALPKEDFHAWNKNKSEPRN